MQPDVAVAIAHCLALSHLAQLCPLRHAPCNPCEIAARSPAPPFQSMLSEMQGFRANEGRQTARCLIVDDDIPVLNDVRMALTSDGHEVTVASSCAAALHAIEQAPQPFPIAFLDFLMPDGLTTTLIPALRERDPGVQCVIISTIQEPAAALHAVRDGAVAFLQKPMTLSMWRRTIARLQEKPRDTTGPFNLFPSGYAFLEWCRDTLALEPLNGREWHTLQRRLMGASLETIGEELCIRPRTVQYHIKKGLTKLGVDTLRDVLPRMVAALDDITPATE